jgi:hypothetical protein
VTRAAVLARVAGWAGWLIGGASIVALVWLWNADRHRHWEEPRWERASFVVLRDRLRAPGDSADTWMVAYNQQCAHCRHNLARAARLRPTIRPAPHLAVLLIDTEAPLARHAAGALAADQVFWDSLAVWRRRWGHRVYGEVLRFDATGRYRGAVRLENAEAAP